MEKKYVYNPLSGNFDLVTVEKTVKKDDIDQAIAEKSDVLEGYAYMGMAEPLTVPDTTKGKCYYLGWGIERGCYVNMGELNFPTTSLCALMWDETEWKYEEILDTSSYSDTISSLPTLPTVPKRGDEIVVARQGYGEQKHRYDFGRLQTHVDTWEELMQALSLATEQTAIFVSSPIKAPTVTHSADTYTVWNISPYVTDIVISGQRIYDIWQLKIVSNDRTKPLNIYFNNEIAFSVTFNPYGGTTIENVLTVNVDKVCNIYNYYTHAAMAKIISQRNVVNVYGNFVYTYGGDKLVTQTEGTVVLYPNYAYNYARNITIEALTTPTEEHVGEVLTIDKNEYDNLVVIWKKMFDENGSYPKLVVGNARNITPEESDAISDDTAFIWQTSGGSANIPESSAAVVKRVCGKTMKSAADGKLYPFKASYLHSRIFNLFDYTNENLMIPNRVVNNNMQVVENNGYNLFFVPVLAGVNNGNNGYVVTYKNSSYSTLVNVGFSTEPPTAETTLLTQISQSTHGNSTTYFPPSDGYLIFSYEKSKMAELCIHFAWSGYNDEIFKDYEESTLELPDVAESGLYGIGSVYDEITTGKYIRRIGVCNTKDLTWTRWTETVYNPSTQQDEEQFQGYKSNSLTSSIKKSTTAISTDDLTHLSNWQTDANGVLKVISDSESDEILAQLTTGVTLIYELATAEETTIAYNGIVTVGDFGDMRFYGTQTITQNNADLEIPPSVVEVKYGVNYRDTIREIANSGAVFKNGIKTPCVFYGDVQNVTLSGTLTIARSALKRLVSVTLTNSDNTIVLPEAAGEAFSIQIKVIQDATGSRNLTLTTDNSNTVNNPSEFDFSTGGANQKCIATLLWDGSEWWVEATKYVD